MAREEVPGDELALGTRRPQGRRGYRCCRWDDRETPLPKEERGDLRGQETHHSGQRVDKRLQEMGRPQGKEETGVGGSPYFPGSGRGENKEGCGGQGDLRRSGRQGCSKGHQDRELGDPEKVVEAEESESLAGAMGKKPRRITGRSWVGAGRETQGGDETPGRPLTSLPV